jgi:DNA-binding transcriptional regulator YiaG
METTDLLRRAIAKAGSQRNLASAVAVSESTVSLWVSGQRQPNGRALGALLKYIGTPISEVRKIVADRAMGGAA